ncbi:YciI family protein [Leifsonia shinshuensis]|uniref:Transcriptional regulator n=1 Tax=Leifsonia shinshuensis TaxID=150026 RepID=A0A7G6YAK2_9MICO|nr:YciI family protein [Leifsonia shinshuensis]QNE35517.1 transcriptional regulator [Leifsonia shinshuensis]
MRFLLLIQNPADRPQPEPDAALGAALAELIDELAEAGALIDTAGLRPPEEGVRVRLSGAALTVRDGPYTETKEFVGGYCLVRAESIGEATEWAKRFLAVHRGDWEMAVEVRALDEE